MEQKKGGINIINLLVFLIFLPGTLFLLYMILDYIDEKSEKGIYYYLVNNKKIIWKNQKGKD